MDNFKSILKKWVIPRITSSKKSYQKVASLAGYPQNSKAQRFNGFCFMMIAIESEDLLNALESYGKIYGKKDACSVYNYFQKLGRDNPEMNKYVVEPMEEFLEVEDGHHFPECRDVSQGEKLYRMLKDKQFVDESTERLNFLYQMGCTEERPMDVLPIKWLKNKQLLREMLEGWLQPIFNNSFTKAMMERICPHVFINKKGEKLSLSKNKSQLSWESSEMEEFFQNI